MKIEHTYLCLDCDELFQPRDQGGKAECPACASRSCAPISGWITSWSAFDRLASKTDFGDTTAGFILGIDDSDGNINASSQQSAVSKNPFALKADS